MPKAPRYPWKNEAKRAEGGEGVTQPSLRRLFCGQTYDPAQTWQTLEWDTDDEEADDEKTRDGPPTPATTVTVVQAQPEAQRKPYKEIRLYTYKDVCSIIAYTLNCDSQRPMPTPTAVLDQWFATKPVNE